MFKAKRKKRKSGKFPSSPLYRAVLAFFLCALTAIADAPAMAEEKPPIDIIAFGDSLTAGYGLAPGDGFVPQLQAALTARGYHVRVGNGGVSGDTSTGGLARLDWVVGPKTRGVILELGANDMLRGIAPSVTRANLTRMIETLQARNIEVMLAGMVAAPNLGTAFAARFNPIYPQLAAQYGLVFYPFFLDGVAGQRELNLPDGIHPTAEGIGVIVENIMPQVEAFMARLEGE